MNVFQQIFAGLVLATCALLLLRMVIGDRRRYRFDAAARRLWSTLRRFGLALHRKLLSLWHWRASRRQAAEAAEEAIRRARSAEGSWDGNVYKPKTFRKPPRDKMH
ncbi:MAG: hypothetical protein ABI671_05510 [Burkholderiales bacterium]